MKRSMPEWVETHILPANAPPGSKVYTAQADGGRLVAAADRSQGAYVVNVAFESLEMVGCICEPADEHPINEACPGAPAPARWPTFDEIQSALNILVPRGTQFLMPAQAGKSPLDKQSVAFLQLFEGNVQFEVVPQ